MSDSTAISWTDSTFNPWTGCTKVSPGCDSCYAESWSKRAGEKVGKWGPGAPRVRTTPANWRKPLQWNGEAFYECSACGWRGTVAEVMKRPDASCCERMNLSSARRRVFCASLADVFDNEVPQEWRRDLFNLILSTPSLDWLLLTKRIGNAARMIEETLPDNVKALPPDCPVAWPWPNVWIGATIVNQEEADRDIPKLLATPAHVRFLSIEPLLGKVDLRFISHEVQERADDTWTLNLNALTGFKATSPYSGVTGPKLDWVIVGGESGAHARPMHPGWVRSLRDQCAAAGVPLHFKQWGEFASVSEVNGPGAHHTFPDGATVRRVGNKAAGRLLDGVEHNGFPEVA